jgi:hypothetical protein
MFERDLTPIGLERRLGYNSQGYLVRTYLGWLDTHRAPSDEFLGRLEAEGFEWDPAASFAPREAKKVTGTVAAHELPPGTLIVGKPRRCPECVAEAQEGKRLMSQTWYVFPYGNQKYCSVEHRKAWYRRERRRQLRS